MKKKLSALLLSAVLCVTAIPVTGMAAEFSDGSVVETLEEDVSEAPEESSGQEEASLDVSDDAEILDYEDESVAKYWPSHIDKKNYIFGCGICQSKVPCRDRRP